MLVHCPNSHCHQKVVLTEGYGKLPSVCPRCHTNLQIAMASVTPQESLKAGEHAMSLDAAEMTYVPPGPFIMGSDLEEIKAAFTSASQKYMDVMWIHFERELPKREVTLPGFWIDVTPVTCVQYKRFCDDTGYQPPEYWAKGDIPDGQKDHPVVNMSWNDVLSYCSWAGKRIPYESEWEKAARGTDGRIWPWGNEYRENCGNIDRGLSAARTPVGSFPENASPYGCLDMAGNIFEWTRDICVQYPGYKEDGELRAIRQEYTQQQRWERTVISADGVSTRETRPFQFFGTVARGGAVASCPEYCRTTFRLEVTSDSLGLGFRCILGDDPCERSRELGHEGKYEEAVISAERSLALSPNYPTALYNAGYALQNLDRYQKAANKFHKLVDVWPTDHQTWNSLGLCYSALGESNKALYSFDVAIYAHPFGKSFWYNKAMELGNVVKALLKPHTILTAEGHIMLNLSELPIGVIQSMAELETEAASCFQREMRLGAKDEDVTNGYSIAKQNSEKAFENMRGKMQNTDFIRATARAGFCESFPIIQQIWSVIRIYHADKDFSYEPLRKNGFDDSETSTCLTYLKQWGRIETVALKTFRVSHTDDISSYDPWREFV